MRADYYVYCLFRPDTGAPFYIGKGKGHRAIVHQCPSAYQRADTYKARIVRKYKDAGREIPTVKLAVALTESEAFHIEKAFIAALGRYPNGPLANATDGGEGASGYRNLEKMERLHALMRGKPLTAEHREKIGGAQRGRKMDACAVEKMAATKRGRALSQAHRDAIGRGNAGRVFSEETRRKISLAQKGKSRPSTGPLSEATKLAISEANKRAWARRKAAQNADRG